MSRNKVVQDTKNEVILAFIEENPGISSKEIHDRLQGGLAYATVKRTLQSLLNENLLTTTGK